MTEKLTVLPYPSWFLADR